RCVEVAADDGRHDGGIHHTQAGYAVHPAIAVYHGLFVCAHRAGAGGMEGAFDVGTHPGIDVGVGLDVRPRAQFVAAVRVERGLGEDFAREFDAVAYCAHVLRILLVVEQNAWWHRRLGGLYLHAAPAFRPHGADVRLVAVATLHV